MVPELALRQNSVSARARPRDPYPNLKLSTEALIVFHIFPTTPQLILVIHEHDKWI